MDNIRRKLARTPVLGRGLLFAHRARTGSRYLLPPLSTFVRWLFVSNETTNFTYDLEATNERYLASMISDVTGARCDIVLGYIAEPRQDRDLLNHILAATKKSSFSHMADEEVRFGRRLGWYAFVRALKPKTVVETGVDKGLGACVLAAALKRNRSEGFPGTYYGTDIDPDAGYLFSKDYSNYGRILYGDSIESLNKLEGPIDLFINDSDHSMGYEAAEYRTIAPKLSEQAVILGDNSHVTDALFEFSRQTDRHFVFFHEKPSRHWYPGAGIGISFRRRVTTP